MNYVWEWSTVGYTGVDGKPEESSDSWVAYSDELKELLEGAFQGNNTKVVNFKMKDRDGCDVTYAIHANEMYQTRLNACDRNCRHLDGNNPYNHRRYVRRRIVGGGGFGYDFNNDIGYGGSNAAVAAPPSSYANTNNNSNNNNNSNLNNKCSVCLDPYDQPHISTGCGHTLCYKCWDMICFANEREGLCPICRAPFHMNKLVKNFALQQ